MQSGRADSKIDRPRDLHLKTSFCDENVNFTFRSSSEDDNSPDMNCKKVIDKPTLVSFKTRTKLHGMLKNNDSYFSKIRLNDSQWDC